MIGRKTEIQLLQSLETKVKSSFVAVYGRRRVGKTFLIRELFEKKFTFHVTGVANVTKIQQLANFQGALTRYFPNHIPDKPCKTWFQIFEQFIFALENHPAPKKILFLDELPWLDNAASDFLPALEHFWNSWASARKDILLIVCGSAAAWIVNQLLNHRGGLHNRVTHKIQLDPFTLAECEAFFQSQGAVYDRYQLIQLYMALGGIPFYLDMVDIRKSAAQNIDDLCFSSKGFLRSEFDNLYASLFRKAEKHISVIEALAKKMKGLERQDLLTSAKLPDNGHSSNLLKELEQSSFIKKYYAFGKDAKNALYQLTDFYSIFYLKFIKHSREVDKNTWINSLDSPEVRAWSGFAFERVCLYHLDTIKKALGITGMQTVTSSWIGSNDKQKVQIDLVIDRRDQVINLCEMKFSITPFVIDKKYADELRAKITVFRSVTETKKALFLTFITPFGLNSNAHSQSLVQNTYSMDILFEDR